MPRGGQESWRDRFLRETKDMKGKGGAGRNPFMIPIKHIETKAKARKKKKKRTA